MFSYNVDQEDEITVKKDDIVDVVTAELSESESLKQDPLKLRGNSSNIWFWFGAAKSIPIK